MIIADTHTITIHEDEFSGHPNCYRGWSEEYAQTIVINALKKMQYEHLSSVKFKQVVCRELIPGRRTSTVCYLEVQNVGFFFVMRDQVDHINVIYNRWD